MNISFNNFKKLIRAIIVINIINIQIKSMKKKIMHINLHDKLFYILIILLLTHNEY
jgi:hypothetical protein